jgi:hypothetical protein
LKKLTNNPPMMAVKMPATGGNPLAMDIPRHSGRAMRKTRNPERISDFQLARKPFIPPVGICECEVDM